MALAPLLRLLAPTAVLGLAAAMTPLPASAAPDPARTVVVASAACLRAMEAYPTGDDDRRSLEARADAWSVVARSGMSGAFEESSWAADPADVEALQTAVAWMAPELVDELGDRDDVRRSAEDDLVWAVQHLDDGSLDRVLQMRLDERTAWIAEARARAARDDRAAATPARAEPDQAAATRSVDAAAVRPAQADPEAMDTVANDSSPDASPESMQRFERRVREATAAVPDDERDQIDRARSGAQVHDFGTLAILLDWTLQQGDPGRELLARWSDDTEDRVATMRSILLAIPAEDTEPGVLDGCTRALVAQADGDRLDEDRARALAREDVARRLNDDGSIRPALGTTVGSAHLRACVAAIVDARDDLGLDDRDVAALQDPDAERVLDREWDGEQPDPSDGHDAVDAAVRFWDRHQEDDAYRETVARVADGSARAGDLVVDCVRTEIRSAADAGRIDEEFLGRVAVRVVRADIDAHDQVAAVDPAPGPVATAEPAPVATLEPAPEATAEPAPVATLEPAPEPSPIGLPRPRPIRPRPIVVPDPIEEPIGEPIAEPTPEPTPLPTASAPAEDLPAPAPTVGPAPTAGEPVDAPTPSPAPSPGPSDPPASSATPPTDGTPVGAVAPAPVASPDPDLPPARAGEPGRPAASAAPTPAPAPTPPPSAATDGSASTSASGTQLDGTSAAAAAAAPGSRGPKPPVHAAPARGARPAAARLVESPARSTGPSAFLATVAIVGGAVTVGGAAGAAVLQGRAPRSRWRRR